MSEFRKEFIQALELLARAFERVAQAGYPRPILVGGAAVEFYTGGAVEMLEQAVRLLQLARPMDDDYLNRRIKRETSGAYDLAFLQAKSKEWKR